MASSIDIANRALLQDAIIDECHLTHKQTKQLAKDFKEAVELLRRYTEPHGDEVGSADAVMRFGIDANAFLSRIGGDE